MSAKQKWLAAIAVPPFLLGVFIVGLFVFMNATARPLHPDPSQVTSLTQGAVAPKWSAAAEAGRKLVRAALVRQNLPGLSVAVGAGGDVVWAEGFGWADLDKRIPVAAEMRFRIGAASMPLTSAAVGLLLEKERLNLDVDIQRYVPAFPEKQWPVTLRELMGHTAGIRKDEGDEEPLAERCERTSDGLRRFASAPLQFEPGTRHRFSPYGWILVSAAVEAAAAEPFFAFMQTKVLEPLGLKDTTPDVSTDSVPDRATFYYPRFAADPRYGPEPARQGDYSCFAGGGGFLSTPSDLVRFAMAINGGRLLKPDTVRMLQTSQHLASGDETGYGLGWDLETVSLGGRTTDTVGHDSEFVIGGSTSLMTFPARGLVVAVTTNITFANTSAIAVKIAEAFPDQAKAAGIR